MSRNCKKRGAGMFDKYTCFDSPRSLFYKNFYYIILLLYFNIINYFEYATLIYYN